MDTDNKFIIYQTEDGQTQIDVRLESETVWLTQQQIAELFGIKRPAITKHQKNIYESEEFDENSTCSILEHMGIRQLLPPLDYLMGRNIGCYIHNIEIR